MNITIIGAGPIGCYAGYLLAKASHTVTIYENHPTVGVPIQCTGLLTKDFNEFDLSTIEFLVDTMQQVEVLSPSNSVTLPQSEYLVCRTKFDQYFASLAIKAGATILTSHSFQSQNGGTLNIKDTKTNKLIQVKPDIIIGADGPLSPTAKAFGFYESTRKNYYGVQATVKDKFTKGLIQTHFSNSICPGLFAWVVAENATTARVGLATFKDSKHYFDIFMKKHNYTASQIQAGTIPLYNSKQRLQKDNVYLVGDAATFVKATTLGGLIPGLKQARALTTSIQTNQSYTTLCKPIAKRLRLHLFIRQILDQFSDKDFDFLVKYTAQPRIKNVLLKHTRENPSPILIKVALKEPRFARFAKHLKIKNLRKLF